MRGPGEVEDGVKLTSGSRPGLSSSPIRMAASASLSACLFIADAITSYSQDGGERLLKRLEPDAELGRDALEEADDACVDSLTTTRTTSSELRTLAARGGRRCLRGGRGASREAGA